MLVRGKKQIRRHTKGYQAKLKGHEGYALGYALSNGKGKVRKSLPEEVRSILHLDT